MFSVYIIKATCCVLSGVVSLSVGRDALSHRRTAVLHRWQVRLIYPGAFCHLAPTADTLNTALPLRTQAGSADAQIGLKYLNIHLRSSACNWPILVISCPQYLFSIVFLLELCPINDLTVLRLHYKCKWMVQWQTCVLSRFYLGGPTSVRGFGMYSIGPQSEGEHCQKPWTLFRMSAGS